MLDQPEPEVINYWLAACVDRRRHVWPDHWQLLAELAMASVAYKRLLLARAIGGQGIGFSIRTLPGLVWQVAAAISDEATRTDKVPEPTSERTVAIQRDRRGLQGVNNNERFTAAEHDPPACSPRRPNSIDRTEASGVS